MSERVSTGGGLNLFGRLHPGPVRLVDLLHDEGFDAEDGIRLLGRHAGRGIQLLQTVQRGFIVRGVDVGRCLLDDTLRGRVRGTEVLLQRCRFRHRIRFVLGAATGQQAAKHKYGRNDESMSFQNIDMVG